MKRRRWPPSESIEARVQRVRPAGSNHRQEIDRHALETIERAGGPGRDGLFTRPRRPAETTQDSIPRIDDCFAKDVFSRRLNA